MTDQHHPDDRPIDDDPASGHHAGAAHPDDDPTGAPDPGFGSDPGDRDGYDLIDGLDDDAHEFDDDDVADADPVDDLDDDAFDDESGTGHLRTPIALDLDDDLDGDSGDEGDDGDGDGDDGAAPLDDGPIAIGDPVVSDGYGASTMAALADLGGVDPALLQSTLVELGLDEAVDARSAVVALERLGVETRVVFGDVDQLAELVGGGAAVRLGDATLVAIDDRSDEALVEHPDGRRVRLPLDDLEAQWAEHGYEFVLGAGQAVLPVTIAAVRSADDVGGLPG